MKNMCVTCIKCKDEIQYSGFYSMEKANNILHFCSEECLREYLAGQKAFIDHQMLIQEFRMCSECDSTMDCGFVIGDGKYYFCSEECLDKNLTKEEYLEMYADGEGDSYWTEWECSTAGGMMKCLKL